MGLKALIVLMKSKEYVRIASEIENVGTVFIASYKVQSKDDDNLQPFLMHGVYLKRPSQVNHVRDKKPALIWTTMCILEKSACQ